MLKINGYLSLFALVTTLQQANALAKISESAPSTNKRESIPLASISTVRTPVSTSSKTTADSTAILKYADSGVGSPYVWGGSRWSTSNRKLYGADCSGFTQKSWGYPRVTRTDQSLGGSRLSTREFYQAQDGGYPWKRLNISHSASLPGDAMVYRKGKSGHIFLVKDAQDSGVKTVEARGKKYGIGYSKKNYKYLKNKGYKVIRLGKN